MGKSNKKGRATDTFVDGFRRFDEDRSCEEVGKRVLSEIFEQRGTDSVGDAQRGILELYTAQMVEHLKEFKEESRRNYNPGSKF